MQKQIQQKKQTNKFVKWISSWSAYAKNKTINALMFWFSIFIIGGTNYAIMFQIFIPTFFILDLFIIIFLVSPIFFFKKTMFDRIYLPIIIALLTASYTVNTLFHDYFGSVFPFKDFMWAIQNAAQVTLHSDGVNWWWMVLNIALVIIFSLGIILYNALWRFQEPKSELKIRGHRKVAFALSLMFGSLVCFEASLQIWCAVQRKNKAKDIDYVNYVPNKHFSELGMIGYYVQESRQLMSDKGESISTIKNYFNNGSYLNDSFTGLLGSKNPNGPANIMVVVLETGDSAIINRDTMRTLTQKLFDRGVWCNQNYSFNHTNISDALLITGNYPQTHFDNWKKTQTPFALPSILGDSYQKYYTHDISPYNDTYHRRSTIKGLGFDECWFHEQILPDLEPWRFEWSNYTQDSKFIDSLLNKVDGFESKGKPFYLHYLTVHMHMDQIITPQNKSIYQEEEAKYGDRLEGTSWKNPFKPNSIEGKKFRRLTLKSMDFDTGLGNIWEKLYGTSSSAYLKNTLLVVCADHSWYESDSNRNQLGPASKHIYDKNNIKGYSTVLGFYHPLLEQAFGDIKPNHQLDKPTWPSVVVPTILDLLGQEYNPRFYLNKSIFDDSYDENEIFYSFWNYRFMNEKFTSWDHYNISNNYGGNKQEAKEFKRRLAEARWQLRIIDSIYKERIFNKYDYKDFMPQINKN